MEDPKKQEDYRLFWEETISRIQAEVTKQDINLWFSRMSYYGSRQNTVIISVPSNFHRDQIKARYLDLIEEKLSELSKGSLSIEFQIASNSDEKLPQSISPEMYTKSFESPLLPEKVSKNTVMKKSNRLFQSKQLGKRQHPALKEEYTFDNFIIGENNNFAANVVMAIAKNPGTSYNPCSSIRRGWSGKNPPAPVCWQLSLP